MTLRFPDFLSHMYTEIGILKKDTKTSQPIKRMMCSSEYNNIPIILYVLQAFIKDVEDIDRFYKNKNNLGCWITWII